MARQAYHEWVRAGRPWKLATPIKTIGERLQAHGYTVYTIGNDAHLTSDAPEDHTPYSVTGWPGKHPYPYVLAMDVMPPQRGQKSKIDGKPLPSLQALGRQMRADKLSGHAGMAWLKYLNWEPERDGGGPCWHDSWQPNYKRRASSDRGHIHASARTDFYASKTAAGYDPVARIRAALTPQEGDDMSWTDKLSDTSSTVARFGKGPKQAQSYLKLSAIHAYDASRNAAAARLAAEAVLSKLAGADADTVIERIDHLAAQIGQHAADEALRDAAAETDRTQLLALIGQLLALLGQHTDGTLDANATLRRIGEILTAASSSDDNDTTDA